MFSKQVRFRLNNIKNIWNLLRSITLWDIWITRNDVVFNNIFWNERRIQQYVWDGLLDYGRLDWSRTLERLRSAPKGQQQNILLSFDKRWTRHGIIAQRVDLQIRWSLIPPSCLLISW
jgi:hypothetical protein